MTVLGPISARGCGCAAAGGGNTALTSIDDAMARIAEALAPLDGTQAVPLDGAAGRILAEPVRARDLSPRFDCSAMDGYAVASAAFTGAGPWDIDVTRRVAAGDRAGAGLRPSEAARIFTGAPIPPGADTVIPQENVTLGSGDRIEVRQRPVAGANVRRAGGDMRPGQVILDAGCRLGPRQIAAAAAAGVERLQIRRKLRVGLVATGTEIRAPGDACGPAQIRDINTPMLQAAVSGAEFDLVDAVQEPDDPVRLHDTLARLAERVDLILTTGGVSVGEEDHVRSTMTALGARTLFSGVAVKPGKPVSFGTIGRTAWLGLPGNPLAALVIWQVFGVAVVDALLGLHHRATRRHVVTARGITRKPGRCEFRPAVITGFDARGREVADFGSVTESSRVAGLPGADGLIFIAAATGTLPKGARVVFRPFERT